MEEEAREYVTSVHIEDDPVDKYSLPEQQQQLQEDLETEIVVEETSIEEPSPSIQNVAHTIREPPAHVEEPFDEPPKRSYASIVCSFFCFWLLGCVCLCHSLFLSPLSLFLSLPAWIISFNWFLWNLRENLLQSFGDLDRI